MTAPPPHVRNDILGKWSLARASSSEGKGFFWKAGKSTRINAMRENRCSSSLAHLVNRVRRMMSGKYCSSHFDDANVISLKLSRINMFSVVQQAIQNVDIKTVS